LTQGASPARRAFPVRPLNQTTDEIEVVEASGNELHALFFGEDGRDRLVGGAHDDILIGAPGIDRLNGQARRDTCVGGPGADVLRNCEIG
jgi:Ca2+-binding RTX toxin-like protein